jgi:hypothetical protein
LSIKPEALSAAVDVQPAAVELLRSGSRSRCAEGAPRRSSGSLVSPPQPLGSSV